MAGSKAAADREFVSFTLRGQDYCIDVMGVREIRGWTPTTALPQMPHFVCGMVNLRGAVLPIIDLSARLGFASAEPTARHVIIVVDVGDRMVGLLVDAVSDILTAGDDAIQPTPDIASDAARTFVRGILAREGRMISLIVLDSLLPTSDRLAA